MENKNFELPLTTQALAELSASTAALVSALKAKQAELDSRQTAGAAELNRKQTALAGLQKASVETLSKVEGMISQLDKVLENNGTGNHNN